MIRNSIARAVSSLVARPVNGAKLSFEIVMKKLFANGEQGFFYDPNDLSTLYQDAAGTVPVTAQGQPVGLILDKSKGLTLGSELTPTAVTTSGWEANNAAVSSDGINLTVTVTALGQPRATCAFTTTPGRIYKLTVNQIAPDTTPNSNQVRVGTTAGGTEIIHNVSFWIGSKLSQFFVATSETTYLSIGYGETAVGQVSTWTNISIKELSGNHAYQFTSAARPILRDTPRRIDFDTVDDKLITRLPAQLTGCTVIRSVPNVGTQILTGQTIPATYEDNKDHCGLLVINRALTPGETSAITAEFNKRAGV